MSNPSLTTIQLTKQNKVHHEWGKDLPILADSYDLHSCRLADRVVANRHSEFQSRSTRFHCVNDWYHENLSQLTELFTAKSLPVMNMDIYQPIISGMLVMWPCRLCICACARAAPHPLCTSTFGKGVLDMIDFLVFQEDCGKCGCKKVIPRVILNKKLQTITTMYFQNKVYHEWSGYGGRKELCPFAV